MAALDDESRLEASVFGSLGTDAPAWQGISGGNESADDSDSDW